MRALGDWPLLPDAMTLTSDAHGLEVLTEPDRIWPEIVVHRTDGSSVRMFPTALRRQGTGDRIEPYEAMSEFAVVVSYRRRGVKTGMSPDPEPSETP